MEKSIVEIQFLLIKIANENLKKPSENILIFF